MESIPNEIRKKRTEWNTLSSTQIYVCFSITWHVGTIRYKEQSNAFIRRISILFNDVNHVTWDLCSAVLPTLAISKGAFYCQKGLFGMFQNVISKIKIDAVQMFCFHKLPTELINLFACEEKSPHAYFSDKYVGFSSQASGFFLHFCNGNLKSKISRTKAKKYLVIAKKIS